MSSDEHALLNHIEEYWQKLRVTDTVENKLALGLPNPYYAPSVEYVEGFAFPYMFYWDSYFIAQGLWQTNREPDIIGMAENMFDMIDRIGYVPNSNSFQHLSRSQPPLLSHLVTQIIERTDKQHDHDWILTAYEKLIEEYNTVWIGQQQPHIRLVYRGLSRYYDANSLHALAEAESGWDFTIRFDDTCLNYLPIDLNCLLFAQENQIADLAETLHKKEESLTWRHRAEVRKKIINELMWNDKEGFYFDYDYKSEKQNNVWSLAAYFALFCGVANQHQAQRMVGHLSQFETKLGLSTTALGGSLQVDKQWSYPNGWAPLHDIVCDGLDRYNYHDEARRLRIKWLKTVTDVFRKDGVLYEKYNVVDSNNPVGSGVYPNQHGFGWTNGVTAKFLNLL